MHLDTLTLVTALKMGLRLFDLPSNLVIYHIEHGGGWTPEQDTLMYRRINKAGIRILAESSYIRYTANLLEDRDYFLAEPTWGLAELKLPEVVVVPRVLSNEVTSDRGSSEEPSEAVSAP